MRKSEIKKGHIYSNGKGWERLVVDIGPQYTLYRGQMSAENLQYEVVRDGSVKNAMAGKRFNMTIASFASWSKMDVTNG